MRKRRLLRAFAATLQMLPLAPAAFAAEPKAFLQNYISAAKIMEAPQGYTVDVTLLASDMEEMFQNTAAERKGVDLSGPGLLEVEIGRFVARRVVLRDREGNSCPVKVARAGEDPANDEGVLVSLKFDCATRDVVYDASRLLAVQGTRAWQVVTIFHGAAHRQAMVNAESPPTPLIDHAIGKNSQ